LHICAALDAHTHDIFNAMKKEVHQMSPPRWLARLVVPMITGAAVLTSAPIATADPVNDAYVAQLRAIGITWAEGHDEAMIGMAHLICDDLGWGWTPQQIANQVHANLDQDSLSVLDVGAMVNLAHSTYCANQRCWAPHC
ncbi:MAG: DUF732 domain-containing protein, partial [Mycobacterium sp.]